MGSAVAKGDEYQRNKTIFIKLRNHVHGVSVEQTAATVSRLFITIIFHGFMLIFFLETGK